MREQAFDQRTHKWFELENAMEEKLSGHVASEMEALQSTVEEIQKAGEAASSGWQIPFAILAVIVLAGAGFMYWKYRKMMKGHIL